jgi:hypothetical protein
METNIIKYLVNIIIKIIVIMATLIYQNQSYNYGEGEWLLVPHNESTTFSFLNNSITSSNTQGYLLCAGDEDSDYGTNNNLDGEIISGNKFIWNDPGTNWTSITHGVFTGCMINVQIKYNYLLRVPMGIIRKSGTSMTNTAGGVSYNIINSFNVGGVTKGMNNVNWYNNTFYQDRTTAQTYRACIDIYENDDDTPPEPVWPAHNTKVKNNIFYTKYKTNVIEITANSRTGFECDYNLYWCEEGDHTPVFLVAGTTYTWSEWRALGYDTHSVNVNPNFVDFVNFVPSARLDYGTNLGTDWQTGLSTSATWVVGTTPTTTNQNGTWQVGARVYAATSVNIPTVTTSSISNITGTTATCGGNVTADGGGTVTSRGVCWSTSQNPTTSNSKTTDGTGTGVFTSSITGLNAGTTYYVRAYAANSAGTAYGSQVSFTTNVVIPTVTTTSISSIGTTTATSGGNVTSAGGGTITARGVCWSTSQNPTTSNSKTTNGTGTGSFTSSITGLTQNTTYYVRAYATNSVGTAYGSQVSFTTASSGSATYYLSPSGSDATGNGTISNPWFTLNKAWTVVNAGETIYMRGGTYTYTSQQYLTGKNGSSGNYINIWAYPGETPVITRSSSFSFVAYNTGIYFSGDYVYWKGIEIYNFYQPSGGGNYMGMIIQNSDHNIFELINYHHCGFPFTVGDQVSDTSNDNLFLNCDFHHNYDPYTSGEPYGNADGLAIITAHSCTNTVRGCRMWNNSDDGWDSYANDGYILIDNCWSWNNGYREDGVTTGGNGHGFKLGESTTDYSSVHLYTVQKSLAFHNRQGGFSQANGRFITWLFNNTAYHNADGSDVYNLGFEFSDSGSRVHILRNNIAHANQHPNNLQANYDNCIEDHNSWDAGYTVSDVDFISVNMAGVDGARQADGSLPTLNFLKLAAGSDMINRGVDVGLPYSETYPDLGAFEYTSVVVVIPTVTTTTISSITSTTASGGGNVTSDGGASVTARGVCWSTSSNPTTSNSKTTDGTGTGSFTSSITGLTQNTTYYVRAYAINSVGTAYGSQVSFTTASSGSATYYVSNTGSNSWSGTFAQPFLTINYALTKISGGDIIYVRAGTYNEYVPIDGLSGSSSSHTRILAYSGEYPIIDGTGITLSIDQPLINIRSAYVDFSGFIIRNSQGCGITTNSTATHVTISNCTLHNLQNSGIGLGGDYDIAEYCTLYNVVMRNLNGVSTSWGSGISARRYPNYCIIRHCTVYDCWGEGISTFEATHTIMEDNIIYDVFSAMLYTSDATDCLVQRNLVYTTKIMTNGDQVGLAIWDETSSPASTRNTFINNIVYGCRRNLYCTNLDNVLIANNTFVNSIYLCNARITGTYVNSIIGNNIIVQEDALPCITYTASSGLTFSHNLYNKSYNSNAVGAGDKIGDPLFAKTGGTGAGVLTADYFRLLNNSSAINSAIVMSNVISDYYEIVRGANPDIGAIEYSGDVSTTIPTVTTSAVTYIYMTSASCGGNVTSTGGATVTARGVCWNTSINPTISNSHTSDGTSTGVFNSNITGLSANTLYYVRAYATNTVGTAYGSQVSFTTTSSSNATYYVSTTGNDITGNGTISNPWLTLDKAWTVVNAGETIYLRGGTYNVTDTILLESKSGTVGNEIKIYNYPNEYPILDFGSTTYSQQIYGIRLDNVHYVNIKGIRITNIQPNGNYLMYGLILWSDVHNCTFDNMEFDHINGWGCVIGSNCTYITFNNCDSHHNANISGGDFLEDADGFECGASDSDYLYFNNCRAWWNSDDGWDMRRFGGYAEWNNCWSFWNGYIPDTFTAAGNGIGFKLAGTYVPSNHSTIRRVVNNSIAVHNKENGIDAQYDDTGDDMGMHIYNCTAYDNVVGIRFENYTGGYEIIRNCVSYNNSLLNVQLNANVDDAYNDWNLSVTVTDGDFISVSSSGLDDTRLSDGSLPTLTFLHLTVNSDLINAGINVGLPYSGDYPDLGAFEYTGAIVIPTVTTTTISSITSTTASGGGNVTSAGGGTITARGICWSTSQNPTTSNSKTTDGTGTGVFTSSITGLTQNTTYYVRAYATNSVGTAYGSQVSFTTASSSSATYYVSTTGNDATGDGTINNPWLTLQRAWQSVVAGNTIYMRGGTYYYTATQSLTGKNGTSGNMIKIYAYPGETPVITRATSFTFGAYKTGIYFSGDYVYWKGIEIYNFYQPSGGGNYMGFIMQQSNHNIFELINYHHCGFPFTIGDQVSDISNDNLFLNCDFHHNYDPYTSGEPYGNADGLAIITSHACTNTIRGCRIWSNSDDGWDSYANDGYIIIDKCWAWSNGYREDGITKGGNGHGFKLGQSTGSYSSTHLYTIQNSLAFHNRQGGFSQANGDFITWLYNNTAYHNADSSDVYNLGFEFADSGSRVHVLRNNIAHANQHPSNLQANYDNCTEDHNSWDVGYTISDEDFISVNMTGMDGARQPDGSLPNLNFLKLVTNSDLIHTGVNVGLTTDGAGIAWYNPPSLGAYEYVSTANIPVVTTTAISSITTTTASSGGNVTDVGGSTVTARGVCWATTQNPTLVNFFTNNGTGIGSFTSSLTGLTATTTYYVRAYATNSTGTAYGSQVSFTTLSNVVIPTVTSPSISNITTTGATATSNVTSAGGGTVTARGVCWSTSSNPTTSNSHTTDGTGTGSFTSSITGLTATTTYYVRSYATNSAGTAYGSQVSFTTLSNVVIPTVTTTSITSITSNAATSGGNVTSDGGSIVTARGVCWSTSSNPTTSNSHTTDGTGTGIFTSSITGLTATTTYYVRAYATNSTGTAYGSQVSFTTTSNVVVPTVTSPSISNITTTSATATSNVTSAGNGTVTARGVCWSTSQNPTTSNSHTTDGTGTGIFTSSITGLTQNTTYYVRSYATNSAGTAYGSQVSFTTTAVIPVVPVIVTSIVTNVSTYSATSGGNITSDGGAPVTSRGICWNTSLNPTIYDASIESGSGIGVFTSYLNNLNPSTHYYVRAYAANFVGVGYGSNVQFDTLKITGISLLNGLMGYWKLDETTGAVLDSPGILNGTNFGATRGSSGKLGNSYTFTAAENDYVDIGKVCKPTTGITLTSWIYPSVQINDWAGLIINLTSYGIDDQNGYSMFIDSSKLVCELFNRTNFSQVYSNTIITPNTWHFVALSWNGAIMNVYVDSNFPDASQLRTSLIAYDIDSSLRLGSHSPNYDYNGRLDEVGIWNRALSIDELYTIYNKGNGLTYPFGETPVISLATVTTNTVSNISSYAATCGGNVIHDGSLAVTAKGICWASSPNPTIANYLTNNGTGEGAFTSSLTGLNASTTYYVRAYAINSLGTAYGSSQSFTTLAIPDVQSKIVDHNCTILSNIPTTYIDAAKSNLHIAYQHTSHGSQLITGMDGLYAWKGSTYAWNEGGTGGALDIDDYFSSGDLGNPDWTTWESLTRTYLDSHPNCNVIIWSWCGEVSYATETNINTYLSLMNQLEIDYPYVKFVYMTGHLDGTGVEGNLNIRNEQIRSYCQNNNKWLYDFADIESYNPDGSTFLSRYANDNCDYNYAGTLDRNWALDWQNTHIENVDWYMCYPAHTQALNGNLKAYAAWCLWAKLAGWNGLPIAVPTVNTNNITNITAYSVTCGGNITNDNGAVVTERGVCWNTSINPTLSNSHTHDASGTGSYVSSVVGLNAETNYYIRAYATNSVGTGYGSNLTFTTLSIPVDISIFYVSLTGIDNASRNGGIGQEWASLSYACSRATKYGDLIRVNSGNYIDNNLCSLSRGVSIIGYGATRPNITTSYQGTDYYAYIRLYSSSLTNGNQSISYININGNNLISYRGINVIHRNNVEIHHCNVENFLTSGIFYEHEINWTTPPTTYSTGNVVHDCSINNCAQRDYTWSAGLRLTGDENFLCYNNTFVQNQRTAGYNGNNLNLSNVRGTKVYNNKFIRNDYEGSNWNFFTEIFQPHGGVEWYNNTFIGAGELDLGCPPGMASLRDPGYTYTLSIHDNTFDTSSGTQLPDRAPGGRIPHAIDLESSFEYIYVYNNLIRHYPQGIEVATSNVQNYNQNNLYIYNNIFDNIGFTTWLYADAIIILNESPGLYTTNIDNFHIWNNTIYGGSGNNYGGISITLAGTFTNSTIKNNIIHSFDTYCVDINRQSTYPASMNMVDITYNCFYNNGNNYVYINPVISRTSVDVSTGNTILNPQIDAPTNYHLISNSLSVIDKGTYVGLLRDYDDVLWHNPPSIGAYEYVVSGNTSLPTITTSTIIDISTRTATGGGNVIHDGSLSVTNKGICWSTTSNPTLVNSHTEDGTGEGEFISYLTALNPSTHYYVRAYATNSLGSAYGELVQFNTLINSAPPTVTTSSVTNISMTSASCGGTIVLDGSIAVTSRGVCWAITENPTISNSFIVTGSGQGSFTSNILGLNPSTHYHVRAFGVNAVGTSYGNDVSFNTLPNVSAPTVTTSFITDISIYTASGGGNVTRDGSLAVTSRGICWSTSINPTVINSSTNNGTGTGTFTSSLTSLNPSTYYYVRAYAANSAGVGYGSNVTFSTLLNKTIPSLITTAVTDISTNSAKSGGTIVLDGSVFITAKGVCWSTSPNPTIANSTTNNGTGNSSFVSSLTGLNPSTYYYVRSYAINSVGIGYGNNISFATLLNTSKPTVITSPITNITIGSAISGGNVTSDGNAAVTARGVCWSTSINPTVNNSSTNNGTGLGSYTSSIFGLNSSTNYHVRAYAVNSVGISYGVDISFNTLVEYAVPGVITNQYSHLSSNSVKFKGTVVSNGNSTVTARGFCWNKTGLPTIFDSSLMCGSGLGSFTCTISKLEPSTHYHVRAYAINLIGVGYGFDVSINTLKKGPKIVISNNKLVVSDNKYLKSDSDLI